jgi:hypothetical protein
VPESSPTAQQVMDALRSKYEATTPGEWYPGPRRMRLNGVKDEMFGPGRCNSCNLPKGGELIWSGQANINGTVMLSHVHAGDNSAWDDDDGHKIFAWPSNPEPWEEEIAGPFDWEDGGVLERDDRDFIIAAHNALPALLLRLEELERGRARVCPLLGSVLDEVSDVLLPPVPDTGAGPVEHRLVVSADFDVVLDRPDGHWMGVRREVYPSGAPYWRAWRGSLWRRDLDFTTLQDAVDYAIAVVVVP